MNYEFAGSRSTTCTLWRLPKVSDVVLELVDPDLRLLQVRWREGQAVRKRGGSGGKVVVGGGKRRVFTP